jgi:hypothetical protein
MGTLPSENMADGLDAFGGSSSVHGTSSDDSEQCSSAAAKDGDVDDAVAEVLYRGLAGTVASYVC